MHRCRSYLRARGLFRYSGRRCTLAHGHTGQHSTPRHGLGAPFVFRWGGAYAYRIEVRTPVTTWRALPGVYDTRQDAEPRRRQDAAIYGEARTVRELAS